MSIFTVSQPRMAAVRPPAGGQSLKQNYDLDQVRSYDSTMIQFKNACRIRVSMLKIWGGLRTGIEQVFQRLPMSKNRWDSSCFFFNTTSFPTYLC